MFKPEGRVLFPVLLSAKTSQPCRCPCRMREKERAWCLGGEGRGVGAERGRRGGRGTCCPGGRGHGVGEGLAGERGEGFLGRERLSGKRGKEKS